MTSKNFKQSMVNQDQEIIFEVVKVSGSWAFPAASSIVEATRGKNMYLRLTDDGRSDIFRLDSVKDGENAGETVFGFVGNGGMDLVELTATTDGTGATTGSWDYEPGEGPAGEAIGNLGQPLQWKGPATVAELNAGITGIQPGWTYTLTDAGTLTDGSIDVEIGDEVAWTEDGEWFKVGGDSGKVEVIQVSWDTNHFTYPTYSEIDAIVHTKKKGLCLLVQNPGGSKDCWWVSGKSAASANNYYKFLGERGEELYIYQDGTDKRKYPVVKTGAIAPDYDPSQTYPTVGTAVMQYGTRYVSNTAITTAEEWTPAHWTEKSVEDEIGNVEALLAAL